MAPRRHDALLVLANVLIPIAILIFATGFFPYKPFISGLAKYKDLKYGAPPEAQFDKLVFMVVDALRSDFVYSARSGFEFTQELIRNGEALPFTAHATSPTITMPRVKAITTGSIPSFLDVILNFAESDTTSTLASQDTWLAQIKAKGDGGKLVMYGDDTWLKLFPDTFVRADGTSSFFVSDFTEVDNNVTRHVPDELRNKDWDAMIMHYLGLDHIGHKAGPLSPHMVPKQREMDGIVKQIYTAMTQEHHLKSTLLVVCGDHGMNDGGNHGGSAPGETSPALVFISPKLKRISKGLSSPVQPSQDFDFYTKIEQNDVAPTLAGLLGFPVPLNNLGVFIRGLLPLWDDPNDRTQLLIRNALQMLDIVKASFPDEDYGKPSVNPQCDESSTGSQLACLWRKVNFSLDKDKGFEGHDHNAILDTLYKFCAEAQDVMSSTASNYNVHRLVLGIVISAMVVLLSLSSLSPVIILLRPSGLFYALLGILYAVMMFASSYVEEEQHFWYWMTTGWCWILGAITLRKAFSLRQGYGKALFRTTLLLATHRITQRWNQTGQKHAGAPDIVHDYMVASPILLWALVILTYMVNSLQISRRISQALDLDSFLSVVCASVLSMPALAFKASFTASDAPELVNWLGTGMVEALKGIPLTGSARFVFTILALEVLLVLLKSRAGGARPKTGQALSTLHSFLTLFLITQTRVHNIPLFLLFEIQLLSLGNLDLTTLQSTVTTILLTHTSFYALGNSNAISSIDLSNAYNGVSGFNIAAVGVLVFLSNWAGPVYWSVGGLQLLANATRAPRDKVNPKPGKRSWVLEEHRHLSALAASSPQTPAAQIKAADNPESTGFRQYLVLTTLFTGVGLAAVMLACTLLRTHLFIWTVFSPKYLFAMAWGLGFHLCITIVLGLGLWMIR